MDSRGLAFRRLSRNLSDDLELAAPDLLELDEATPADFVAWGETVCGNVVRKHSEGRFHPLVQVPGRGFLPMRLHRALVLVREEAYEVAYTHCGSGVHFHSAASVDSAITGEVVPRGAVLRGIPDGDFVWVPERGRYLPLTAHGVALLRPLRTSPERLGPEGETPPWWIQGQVTWMLFDDQRGHWRAARQHFEDSTVSEKARASNVRYDFPPLPWPRTRASWSQLGIHEASPRRWHLVLGGSGLAKGRPRSRYRVWAWGHLKSGGRGELSPGSCPGSSPLSWLRREAQRYGGYVADVLGS